MGPQQVLRTAAFGLIAAIVPAGALDAAPSKWASTHKERAAVVDLGPPNAQVRAKLGAALVAAGFEPAIGDGLDDALAGQNADRDALALAVAIGDAERAFGKVDCKATFAAVSTALAIVAARQAAGLAVPELERAWKYELLCADLGGDTDRALRAAAQLRQLGGGDVAATILAKYPDVDATSNAEHVDVDVTTEVAGADVWVDFKKVGVSPAHLVLTGGEHVIAAAAGTRRGALTGTVVKQQPKLVVPMGEQAGTWDAVAKRIAAWHGKLPKPDELAWLMTQIKVRALLVRHGDVVEVWGRVGASEAPHLLGGEDGVRTIAEADRAAALLADRVAGWSSHAPDPDQPLLVEDVHARAARLAGKPEEPAAWWVYAAIGAAVLGGATIVYLHHQDTDVQRVELHYP